MRLNLIFKIMDNKTCDCRLPGKTIAKDSMVKIDLKKFQPYNLLAKEIYMDSTGKVFDTDMKEIGAIRGSNIMPEGITININFKK